MPVLDPSHDLAHAVEGDTAWSESYYFNAYDPGSDTGLFSRIGIRPNEGTADVSLTVWLPGDSIAEYRHVREQRSMVDTVLDVGAVRYQMLEPLRSWRLTADAVMPVRSCSVSGALGREAQVRLDVTFSALTPAFGVDGQGLGLGRSSGATSSAAATVGKGHLEQAGRWSGTVTVDGVEYGWGGARGNRDKSWGPRRWGGPRMWRWFSINIDDSTHFGGIRIGTEAGELHRGWVYADGDGASVHEWRVRSELGDDGLTHRVSHVVAVDKLGREHRLHGDVLRVAAARTRGTQTVLLEGLARWTYEGKTGYGISEYLHQVDALGLPVVPIE